MENKFNPMAEIFKHLTYSLIFMFIGFLVGKAVVPPSIVYVANILLLIFMIFILILALSSRKGIIPRRFSMNYVYVFTFIDGILMYPIFTMYLQDLGTDIVLYVLAGTIAIFAVLANKASKKVAGHYSYLGKVLSTGLTVLIVFSIVGFFINNSIFNMVISASGIAIFTGYMLYDISLIKSEIEMGMIRDTKDLSIHVLNLYLDFINLFLDLLSLISELKD